MTYNITPDNNHYNGTVFKIENNNDFKQKIYLNSISIDTFTKNIDETNNYLMFIRRVSISDNKNPYWLGNGPELEYHLCILHIPTGFYNTINDLINVINSEYLKAISNLNNTETGDVYFDNDIQYLIKIENNNLIFNPNLYAIPICLNNTLYSDDIKYDDIKNHEYKPAIIIQNILNLTSNIQNYETTTVYNYLLNYYSNVNNINGLINYSKNTINLFNKLGILYYKIDFNNTNIAFMNNKPLYLIKGSSYAEFLFIGNIYDMISETTILYNNIENTIFYFNIPIETKIITRPFPISDYKNDITNETRYNMQSNVEVMSISNVNFDNISDINSDYINVDATNEILSNINSETCPYSYLYKTDDITYLDIYDTDHNAMFNIYKQYSSHTFNYSISNVFTMSYYPIDKNNDEYVVEYNVSFENVSDELRTKKFNMKNGELQGTLPVSIENNSIDLIAFYENSYEISTINNVLTFKTSNPDVSAALPFNCQIYINNNAYTDTEIQILNNESKNIIDIKINDDETIEVITDISNTNSNLTFSIQTNTIIDITYYEPYLFISSFYKNDEENSVFETFGLFRTSVKPEIVFNLIENSQEFPTFTATVNSFQLNNISPIETILGPNSFRYQIFNFYNASIRQFSQNYVPNLHPSDKIYVYYSFDENVDKILNNTSMQNEQIFSLLATINLESILKPYATINNNIITYENNVNHIQQNIDKTIILLPYTTIYIYITSNELRYPLQKSDYVLSYEIL